MASEHLKCYDCNMTFDNPTLLQKHKQRFCVGGQLGDPEILLLRKSLRDEEPLTTGTPPEEQTAVPDVSQHTTEQDSKIKELAERHGRQMEFFKSQNQDLQQQREDILRRLQELSQKPAEKHNSTEKVLKELKEQEDRHRKMLDELRQQVAEARQPVNVIQIDQPERKSFVFPAYHGNSLVAEIGAVRQAYIQNGGKEPSILTQLAQLQAEAQLLDDSIKDTGKKQPKDRRDDTSHLISVELENEQLQRQLLLLQQQNMLSTNRRKDNHEDELEREIGRMHRDHLRKMYELQREIERMRQDTVVDHMRLEMQLQQQPTRIILHQTPAPSAPPPQRLPPPTARVPVPDAKPYDQNAGFVIFYDFVLNLDPNINAVRLLVGLHNLSSKLGEPSALPMVYTEPAAIHSSTVNVCNAVIGARQPVPRCPPQSDLGIVVEMQAAGAPGSNHDPTRLLTRAWTKVPLFDGDGRLCVGCFKLPLHHSPIKPYIPFGELRDIAQYGDTELFYRIVHYRDASQQSLATIAAANSDMYRPAPVGRFLPQFVSPLLIPFPSPSPSIFPDSRSLQQSVSLPRSPLSPLPRIGMTNSTEPIIGFQVDRVKHSELGVGKVRLTVYYASTGEVVQAEGNPVTCTTTSVKANFKHEYHVFGQQEATFKELRLQGDMLLIAEFFLNKWPKDMPDDMFLEPQGQDFVEDEDSFTLVAWTALPLVLCAREAESTDDHIEFDPARMRVNTGTKTLHLFWPPVPKPTAFPLQNVMNQPDWNRYGNATLRIHVFQGHPRAGSLTPSVMSDYYHDDDDVPQSIWIPVERKQAPTEPFLTGDGLDIYIDGCRHLPDSVTFTRVAGRILDRRYNSYGKDISTSVKLDSNIFNPVYEHREEFREPFIPPSATLVLKVYTIDKFYRLLTVVGYAALNVFVETGTERQPCVDKSGPQISVNEGCHQVRLYHKGPDEGCPLSEGCLRESNTQIVPCASLLVRLHKVPSGPHGRPLESDKIHKSEWARLGLWHPRPKYSDGVYISSKCTPTPGERKLFRAQNHDNSITVRKAVAKLAKAKDSFLSDKTMHQYMRNQLTKSVDSAPLSQDLAFIAPYSPRDGIRCALYNAVNLPWSNFTFGHICLNPPGAFYMGVPYATYDKPVFMEKLKASSTNSCPKWNDGYMYFPRRSFHRYLCIVFHLQEIFVQSTKGKLKYGLLQQAWAPIQVFKDRYASVSTFQLPLISGAPSQHMLTQLAQKPCKQWIDENINDGSIKLVEGASLIVRLCDARHDEESDEALRSHMVEIDTQYLPEGKRAAYSKKKAGSSLKSLVPDKQEPEEFMGILAAKFKSLVFKLYEEGKFTSKTK